MNKKLIIVGLLSISSLVFISCNKNNESKIEEEINQYDSNDSDESEESDYFEQEEETTSNINKVSSKDIDDLLDSYESYMNDYISYLKKAKNNDMSMFEDLPNLMSKGEDLGNKMDNVKSEMSTSQMNRMIKMVNKVNMAMAELQ
ncbi:hypothetical protein H4K35_06900 [Myroides sp. NP-2]|uniref:DUF6591 domain-containing protein n=1 Tax=Myroides sp. NP-2 TaxID=2759945 RepID=UPI0015F8B542|nr:DUF6591 domain-containing protein [Myroides sp. NP-2]MBB1149863.1 hypothetical protein [Myroides sp. NP-2]